jgi:hypothetical protein
MRLWGVIAGDPMVEAPTNISLFEWGIRAENHLRNISASWENFDSFSETRNHVLLRARGRTHTTVFPKRDLTSSQLNLLLTVLSVYLKGKRRSRAKMPSTRPTATLAFAHAPVRWLSLESVSVSREPRLVRVDTVPSDGIVSSTIAMAATVFMFLILRQFIHR